MLVKELPGSYVGGKWIPPGDHDLIEVVNPATEEALGSVASGGQVEVDAAVAAARGALAEWSATPLTERAALLREIARRLESHSEELARTMTADVGTPFNDSERLQVAPATRTFTAAAAFVSEAAKDRELDNSLITREPLGVVGCITPWNYPIYQMATKVAPALAAGCTLVAKPSALAPLGPLALADAIHEVGLPAGVFNLVLGTGQVVGEAIVKHEGVDAISFTGSTEGGRRVAAIAANRVKHLSLELGGKSPSVVLPDADVERAVAGTIAKCFQNAGQTCAALTRLLVPRNLLKHVEELAADAVRQYQPGDPQLAETRLGPLASAKQLQRVLDYVRGGISQGAKLVSGGDRRPTNLTRGYFMMPTVFSKVSAEMVIAREEIFGPVLVVMPYDDEREAVTIANSTDYGLSAAVWSKDVEHAVRVARQLRSGSISINGAATNPDAPFGGFNQSGYGRERGQFGIEEFLTTKAINR